MLSTCTRKWFKAGALNLGSCAPKKHRWEQYICYIDLTKCICLLIEGHQAFDKNNFNGWWYHRVFAGIVLMLLSLDDRGQNASHWHCQ